MKQGQTGAESETRSEEGSLGPAAYLGKVDGGEILAARLKSCRRP